MRQLRVMRRTTWLAVVVALAASACGAEDGGAGSGSGKVDVVAGFYPLAEAAARVGGDRVSVANLTPAGAEPHDLEPGTRDVDRIEAADVVLFLGGGFQPGVEKAAKRSDGRVVDLLSPDLGLIDGYRDEDGHLGTDPHVWLDPTLMAHIVERVAAALADADPDGRATYESNAAAYLGEISALDQELQDGLASCARRTIVTSHAAFGYLARRYQLTQDPITGLSPEAEPDPRRLSELSNKVRAEGITTIFYESLVSPRVAQTLARETGARTAVLDPIEGLTKDEQRQGETYGSQMRQNLAALRSALDCR